MRWTVGVAVLAISGCATMPPYCAGMLEQNRAIMAAKSDTSIAWIGTALTQIDYKGTCPCPDGPDENGNKCGGRSAYSRSHGAYPACYPDQIFPSEYPRIRAECAHAALPFECGGMNVTSCLTF